MIPPHPRSTLFPYTTLFRSEDQGPLAHAVRPDSYIEIGNFYTTTIYNKGAEVIRMFHTVLGPEKFRKGTDLYFERQDRKSTRLNSSHSSISYAVFCLKKKKK